MKFGRQLEFAIHPSFRQNYIAYKDLKKAIKLITGTDSSSYTINEVTSKVSNFPALVGPLYRPAESRFRDLLTHELDKVNKFIEIEYDGLCASLRYAARRLAKSDEWTENSLSEIRTDIEDQGEKLVLLDSFRRWNFTGFRKITKKYDKHNKSSSSAWYMAKLIREPFMTLDLEVPLILLSVCHVKLREFTSPQVEHATDFCASSRAAEGLPQEQGVPSQMDLPALELRSDMQLCQRPSPGFLLPTPRVESGYKYLVKPEDAMKVKVRLAMHFPIVVDPSQKQKNQLVERLLSGIPQTTDHLKTFTKNKSTHATIYLDSADFALYRRIIVEKDKETRGSWTSVSDMEGWRLRWFGDNDGSPNKLILLEKVDFREPAYSTAEWSFQHPTNEDHIPACAAIDQRWLAPLLDGSLDVGAATSNMEEEEAAHVRGVLQVALDDIQTKGLSPALQIWYQRSVYRHTDICVTIDENIKFVSERGNAERLGPISTSTDILSMDSLSHFEFCVLDVSPLRADANMDFLHFVTGLPSVSEVFAFATYIHGVATTVKTAANEQPLPAPHWYSFTALETDQESEPGSSPNKNRSKKSRGPSRSSVDATAKVDVLTSRRPTMLAHEEVMSEAVQRSSVRSELQSIKSFATAIPGANTSETFAVNMRRGSDRNETKETNENLSHRWTGTIGTADSNIALRERLVNPEIDDQVLEAPAYEETVDSGTPRPGMLRSLLDRIVEFCRGSQDARESLMKTTVRVEPKAFFANERTLLQWMNTAVLLSTIAITLLSLGTTTAKLGGIVLSPVAIFFLVYPFLVYRRRARALYRKEPISYDDRVGPVVLVTSLVSAVSLILVFNINDMLHPADTTIPSNFGPTPLPTLPPVSALATTLHGAKVISVPAIP